MAQLFHVSSAANRESILAHGPDWARMEAPRGIAGSTAPEVEGVYLARNEFEATSASCASRRATARDEVGGITRRQLSRPRQAT